jgi:hypothetical protein
MVNTIYGSEPVIKIGFPPTDFAYYQCTLKGVFLRNDWLKFELFLEIYYIIEDKKAHK